MGDRGGGFWPRITRWLFERLFAVSLSRPPNLVVGTFADPYLLRWWLIPRNPLLNIYLHCFYRSDDDRALHDHPWLSASLLLNGRYVEHTIDAGGIHRRHEYRAGNWRFRTARFAHRLEIRPTERCWSLFITGPVMREWGFHCETGWRPSEDFVAIREGVSSIGAGCEAPPRKPKSFWEVWRKENA